MTTNPIASTDMHRACEQILHTTLRQLQLWEAKAKNIRVIEPKADAEAWEGTELDVGRTVL